MPDDAALLDSPTPAAPPKQGMRTTSLVLLATVAVGVAFFLGRQLFVPIVFAIVLNGLLRPAVRFLERFRLPTPIAAAVIVLAILAALTAAGFALSGPLGRWMADAPRRFKSAGQKLEKLRRPIQQVNDLASAVDHAGTGGGTAAAVPPTTAPATAPSQLATRNPQSAINPNAALPDASQGANPKSGATADGPSPVSTAPGIAGQFVGAARDAVTQLVEVLLLLYLMLASGDLFFRKLIKVIPLWRDKAAAADVVERAQSAVMRYMWVNLLINSGQGVVVGLTVWALGMPAPILWALATIVLEFIPYLGATVMMILLTVTALATFDDLGHTLAVPAAYLLITTVQNNVVSPYLYGRHLKLNPVAVMVGVMAWWFLWGVPGAFLAVPIVATLKIVADRVESLKAVGEFLGE